jgi:hypothetical protein
MTMVSLPTTEEETREEEEQGDEIDYQACKAIEVINTQTYTASSDWMTSYNDVSYNFLLT